MQENIRLRILVSGRVQGVMFRKYAEKLAQDLGITGHVQNLLDGRVEVVCEGGRENMERFVEGVRKGPRLARVKGINSEQQEHTGEWKDFTIREFGF
ncbi:MAG: acylphosphatase [Candidatus Wildermuthbacteria bacterium]|nr:acylphosphatase [Candidatus Wildermuthbacteria bacterium]